MLFQRLFRAAGARVRRSSIRARCRVRRQASLRGPTADRSDLQARAAHELVERGGIDHPMLRAVRDRAVCMVNPPRCKILHKKASLAVLSDERNAQLFDADERDGDRGARSRGRASSRSGTTTHDGVDDRSAPVHRRATASSSSSSPTTSTAARASSSAGRSMTTAWKAAIRRRSPSRTSCSSASRCRRSRIRARRRQGRVRRPHGRHGALRRVRRSRRRLSHASGDGGAAQRHRGRRKPDAHFHRRTTAGLMKAPSLTLGIEEEYQIIDPETRELKSYITEILAGDHMILDEVKPELHQSMVEIGTRCAARRRSCAPSWCGCAGWSWISRRENGLVIAAAGTHPFSSWMKQEITPLERYVGREGGPAGPRAAAADLRHAHPRRHRGSGVPDRRDERRALSAAARALPVDELAVLAGAAHRTQVVPQHRLPQLSAHRRPADHALVRATTTSCSTRS